MAVASKRHVLLWLAAVSLLSAAQLQAQSYYPQRLDDPRAVYLTHGAFGIKGDGVADDTAAVQAALDAVRDKAGEGIVFLPPGRYRISHTVYVWPSVRLIGYGEQRPVFVLGDATPGYQNNLGYMFVFAGGPPGGNRRHASAGPLPGTVPPNSTIPDANPGTFYSAMSNIDFEMGKGNPAAVAIRFHIAQHCFLTHMTFHIDSGLAALKDVGNEAEDLHFLGGQYGIITGKPSPGWQFTLLDSTFEGQSIAAISEHEAGLTLAHDTFRHVPQAVSIEANWPDELWIHDSTFDDISGAAVTISDEQSPRTEINLVNIVCHNVPHFAHFRESSTDIAGKGTMYQVESFSHGLALPAPGQDGVVRTAFDAKPLTAMPAPLAPAIPAPPAESDWANLRTFGAKGDGVTDDTAAIERAIASGKPIYVPSGRYIVTRTVTLQPNTVMIGLDPSTTQFDLPDNTAAFNGPGGPVPLFETPAGGTNILSGIGLYTNGINNRATALLWRSGEHSLVDDVRFLGGHGTNGPDGKRVNPYNSTHSADPDPLRRWDAQYPSLWVADGGGGTFADIWTPDTYAQAGMYVSDTSTPGFVYELSSEHHVRNEIRLVNVQHWELDALQTEEERGESGFALPLSIDRSSDITVANYHSYRVVSSFQPFRTAIEVHDSSDIRFRNVHVDSDSKAAFDDALVQEPFGTEVRDHEFASLNVQKSQPAAPRAALPPTVVPGSTLERQATGFFNASGGAAAPDNTLYFVDAHRQEILQWNPATRDLSIVADAPIDAANLAVDRSGGLLVTSYEGNGTVYGYKSGDPLHAWTVLHPEPSAPQSGATPWLPADYWVNGAFDSGAAPSTEWQYRSPDGSTFLPASQEFVDGQLYYGVKMAPVLRAFGLTPAVPGKPFYVTDESQERTYVTNVDAAGALGPLKLFVERGGESTVQDAEGNVYLAAGQVYVYSRTGQLLGTIRVPERPIDLVFGGVGKRTLFVFTHTSLYAIHMRVGG